MEEAYKDALTESVKTDRPGARGQREETQKLKRSNLKCVKNWLGTLL